MLCIGWGQRALRGKEIHTLLLVLFSNADREIGLFLSFVYFLARWHASGVSLPPLPPPRFVIFAHLAWPLNDVIFYFYIGNN